MDYESYLQKRGEPKDARRMQFGLVLIKKKGVRKVRGIVSAPHIPKDGGRGGIKQTLDFSV